MPFHKGNFHVVTPEERRHFQAVKYIHANYAEKITIAELASAACVSIKTLERHFFENLKIPPAKYIKNLRLAKAAHFLSAQVTVQEAAEKSGFTDYSKFISDFKKAYGKTSLKFKKSCSNQLFADVASAGDV